MCTAYIIREVWQNVNTRYKVRLMKTQNAIFSFPPSAAPDAEILILGSMPGGESLRQQQYYAHPSNAFWKIMGELMGFTREAPYTERLDAMIKNKIALWDSLKSCKREGSLDSDIKDAAPNDFKSFFASHPGIKKIVFNGKSAQRLFLKFNAELVPGHVRLTSAPSTSPAHASMKYAQKLAEWKAALTLIP